MNNQKNNGIVVIIVEMFIEADKIMELQIEIIIVVVVVTITTINNIGEDHVSFILYPTIFLYLFFFDPGGGGHYDNSYGAGQRQYNENSNRGGGGQRGGPNPNYRGERY
jgi:hypothetical protein